MNTETLKKYHRLSNYLSASMLYLKDNYLLKDELKSDHIKNRILGHWGTVPGISLIYGGLQGLIKDENIPSTLMITGPGHGAPAVLSGLYLDGSLEEFYKKATLDRSGLEYIVKQFSWPGGFPSHTYPGLPGQIHEGGELGYALGVAYGTAMDRNDLLTVSVIGDGEAETGPLAASWHGNKFLNPKRDGAVLPILHLNGYKISGPTIFSTMSDDEINSYFWSLGYEPWIVDQYKEKENIYSEFGRALHKNYERIKAWKHGDVDRLPVIILKTYKGWTGPLFNGDKKLEDNNLSHGIPLQKPKTDASELKILEQWLRSYKIEELLENDGSPIEEIKEFMATGDARLGKNKYATGNPPREELKLPNPKDISFPVVKRGTSPDSPLAHIAEYFEEVFRINDEQQNFRLFSPDESESNKLDTIFDTTDRIYTRDLREHDEFYSKDGRMVEILSEHVLQEMMEGYILTGGSGVLISYEAFLNVISSQIDQYIKYIKQSREHWWRRPVSAMNYISTSTTWRQDHNGFSHQNPTLINSILAKNIDFVSAYFPADVNTLIATFEDSLTRTDSVNLVTTGKRELPQWLNLDEAREHVKRGISIWDWAGNYRSNFTDSANTNKHNGAVDIVLASAGDYQTQETLAAAQILKDLIPELKFQYVNINELTRIGMGDERNPVLLKEDFEHYFTKDRFVIFNFHGYPSLIKQMISGTPIATRTAVLGYRDEGSTTTPFDMQVVNRASRYHVCIQAILRGAEVNPHVRPNAEKALQHIAGLLAKHRRYIVEYGDDMPEVKNFEFSF